MNRDILSFSIDDKRQSQPKTSTVGVVSSPVKDEKEETDRASLIRKAISSVSSIYSQSPAPLSLPFKAANYYIDKTGGVHKTVEEPGLIFESRPFGGTEKKEYVFKSGLSIAEELGISSAFAVKETAQSILGIIPRAIVHTLGAFSELVTGGKADPLKLPFDAAKRMGFSDESVKSTAKRTDEYLLELNRVRTPATDAGIAINVVQSILAVVIPDILDVVFAGTQIHAISLKILQHTKYDPMLERSLSVLGIDEKELSKMSFQEFNERSIDSLRSARHPLEQAEVISSGNYIFEKVAGMAETKILPQGVIFKESELQAIKQLSPYWKKAQEIARDLVLPIEQMGMGFKVSPALKSGIGIEAPELVKMYSSLGIPSPEEVPKIIKSISSLSKKGVTPEMIAKQLETAKPLVDAVVSGIIAEGASRIPNEVLISMTSKLPKLDDVSPVSGLLSDQASSVRATAPLGDSMTTLDRTMGGKPTDEITVYSKTPNKEIVAGDYVTTNKQLAVDYKGGGKLTEMTVKKGDVLDDITNPLGEEYIYRPNAFKEISTPPSTVSKAVKGKEPPAKVSLTPEELIKGATVKDTTPLKTVIKGKPPVERITVSEAKALKDKIQNVSRGADIGAMETREGIQETQKALHNLINESGLSPKYKAELISNIRALAVGKDPITTFRKNLPKTLDKIDNLLDRQIKAAERDASKKLREMATVARKSAITTKGDVKAVQEELINTLKSLGLPKDKFSKFSAAIKNTQTSAQLEKSLPRILDRVNKEVKSARVDIARDDLQRLLNRFKTKKLYGLEKGKLTAEAQKSISSIRDSINYYDIKRVTNPETGITHNVIDTTKAWDKITKNTSMIESGVSPTIEAKLIIESEALSAAGALRSKRIALDVGADKLEKIAQSIRDIAEKGYTARELDAFNAETVLERKKEYLTHDVTLAGKKLDTTVSATPKDFSYLDKVREEASKFYNIHENLDFWAANADTYYKESVPFQTKYKETGWFKETRAIQNALADYNWYHKIHDTTLLNEIISKTYRLNLAKSKHQLAFEKRMSEVVDLGRFKLRDGSISRVKMTRSQLLSKYAQMMQEYGDIRLTHGNQWTEKIKDAVRGALSRQDKEFVSRMIDEYYPKIRAEVNPVHEKLTGVSIGDEFMYNPMPTEFSLEDIDQLSLLKQTAKRKGLTPGAVRARVDLSNVGEDSKIAPLEFDDFFATALSHSAQMRRYQFFAEPVREMRKIMAKGGDVRKALIQRYGEHQPFVMDYILEDISRGGSKDLLKFDALTKLRGRIFQAVFQAQPLRAIKELSSVFLWGTEESYGNLISSLTNMFVKGTYKATAKELYDNSQFLQLRTKFKGYERETNIMATNKKAIRLITDRKTIGDNLMKFEEIGDKGGIYSLGISYYNYQKGRLIAEGMSEKDAMKEAVRLFEGAAKRTQVSAEAIDLGIIQKDNILGQILTQFKTSTMQMMRHELYAIKSLGVPYRFGFKDAPPPKGDWERHISTILSIEASVLLFQYIANAFETDTKKKKARMKRAAIAGPFNSFFMVGDAIEYVARAIAGDDFFGGEITSSPVITTVSDLFKNGLKSLKKVYGYLEDDDDVSAEEVMAAFMALGNTVGMVIGQPIGNIAQLITGTQKFLSGEDDDWKAIFWSDYARDIEGRAKEEKAKEKEEKEREKETKRVPLGGTKVDSGRIPLGGTRSDTGRVPLGGTRSDSGRVPLGGTRADTKRVPLGGTRIR